MSDALERPWTVSADQYADALGVSKDDALARMCARNEWRQIVIDGRDSGRVLPQRDTLHPDAAGVIRSELHARTKSALEKRRAELREASQVYSIDGIDKNALYWHSGTKSKVLIVRKHRAAVDVKGDRGVFRVKVAEGRLWRQSPEEIEAILRIPPVETGPELPNAPARAAVPAAVPGPGNAPAGNMGTGTRERERAQLPHRDIVEHGRSSATALARSGAIRSTVVPGGFMPRLGPSGGAPAEAGGTGGLPAHNSVDGPVPPRRGIDGSRALPSGEAISIETIDATSEIVHVGDALLPMRKDFADGHPRVRDEDFATWLGYERPRDVRKLIGRMVRAGKISDVHHRATVERAANQVAARPVEEFWLTRREALLIATQSETPRAWAMTELIVAVFDAVIYGPRDELVLPQTSIRQIVAETIAACFEPMRAAMREELESQVDRIAARALPAPVGSIGSAGAREITSRITRAAHRAAGAGAGSYPTLRKSYEDRVREHVHFPRERGRRWEHLGLDRLTEARIAIERIERDADERALENLAASQGSLPLRGSNDAA